MRSKYIGYEMVIVHTLVVEGGKCTQLGPVLAGAKWKWTENQFHEKNVKKPITVLK